MAQRIIKVADKPTLDIVASDVSSIKTSVTDLSNDISTIDGNVNTINTNTSGVPNAITTLNTVNSNVNTIKTNTTNVPTIKTNVDTLLSNRGVRYNNGVLQVYDVGTRAWRNYTAPSSANYPTNVYNGIFQLNTVYYGAGYFVLMTRSNSSGYYFVKIRFVVDDKYLAGSDSGSGSDFPPGAYVIPFSKSFFINKYSQYDYVNVPLIVTYNGLTTK